ncbi:MULTISPECIES: hypothetical protein [unclassified Streptomyces]|uniref:hypothetical protein n=1 Tax=unclassified Streptomyces TaxID=2593676 RepID=UPI002E2D90F6|nr:hypothetical protein [Streptomyces sp. NBC_00223]
MGDGTPAPADNWEADPTQNQAVAEPSEPAVGTGKPTAKSTAQKSEPTLRQHLTDLGRKHIAHVQRNLKEDEDLPGAFSVGRDRETGQIFYGASGPSTGLHSDVQTALPGESQLENGRPPGVCAEARMCTNALNAGVNPKNLDIITLNQKGKKFKMCPNCLTWVPEFVGEVLTG